MAADPSVVDAAIAGDRRAYQYLRLLDLGRRTDATALLGPLDDRDLGAVAVGFIRIAKSFASKLPDRTQRRAATRRQEKLAGRLSASLATDGGMRSWTVAHGEETLRTIAALWPGQAQRLPFYETMARATFDAGEPDSEVRRRYFGGS